MIITRACRHYGVSVRWMFENVITPEDYKDIRTGDLSLKTFAAHIELQLSEDINWQKRCQEINQGKTAAIIGTPFDAEVPGEKPTVNFCATKGEIMNNLPVPMRQQNSTGLVNYDAALYYLAESHRVDEVKNFRDQAKALEAISKVANNKEAERLACEIRIRAERRTGELLRETVKAQGKRTDLNLVKSHDQVETLSEMGITKCQSSSWQKLADVPEDTFEEIVTSKKPSTQSIIRANVQKEEPPDIIPESMQIWGRAYDFERRNDEQCDIAKAYAGMTEEMRVDVNRLGPRIIKYWQALMQEAKAPKLVVTPAGKKNNL